MKTPSTRWECVSGRSDGVSTRCGQDAAIKPVPVIINHERIIIARLLHFSLLDQSVERVFHERRRQRQVRDALVVAMEVAVVVAQVLGRLVRHVASTQLPGQFSTLLRDVAPVHLRGPGLDRELLQGASRQPDAHDLVAAAVRGRHHAICEAAI